MVRYLKNLEALAPLGYQVGIHIRFAAPLFMRSTYSKAWRDLYDSQNYALRDPLVFWGISKSGVIRWSDITLPDPFGVMEQATAHGLTYGVVASCGKITSRTIVGAARDDREYDDGEMKEIAAIADALHEVTDPPVDLSPEAVEILRLRASGLDPDAAAAELGITREALEAHLATAQDRLGANTTAETLQMAREFRLI